MAGTGDRVFIDYAATATAVVKLEKLTENLASTLKGLDPTTLLSSNTKWSGKARDEFISCCNDLYDECDGVGSRIKLRAQGIKTAMEEYKKLDSDFAAKIMENEELLTESTSSTASNFPT